MRDGGNKMQEQHDHHCWITAQGIDWYIIGAIPGNLCLETWDNDHHSLITWIDITKVDWAGYTKAAVENDYARYL